jgi:hypothetical protein
VSIILPRAATALHIRDMKTPEQKLIRKQILDACIRKQEILVDDFTTRIRNILKHEGLGNEDEYDNTELAHNSQRFAEINALNQSLSFAASDLNVLKYLSTLTQIMHETPERGAVVITDHGKYFISVSIGQVNVNEDIYTTLSTNSQLFKMMQGKRAGESFEFNRMKYKLEEIF